MKLRPRLPQPLSSESPETNRNASGTEIKTEVEDNLFHPLIIKEDEPGPPVVITIKLKKRRGRKRLEVSKSTICEFCGKKFEDAGYLNEHRERHSNKKSFKCNLCGKGFVIEKDLNCHIKSHLKEERFICNICGKTFSRRSLLNYHVRIHTGERPYKCDKCDMTFTRPFGLSQHKKSQHQVDNSKSFECNCCNKSFKFIVDFQRHVRSKHTKEYPFPCMLCDKRYPGRGSLSLHRRSVHDKDKLLVPCPKGGCSKVCDNYSALNAHIRFHHPGEALFKCHLCSMDFEMKSQLNRHMRCANSHVKKN